MQHLTSPGSERFPERPFAGYTFLDRYDGALAAIVDDRNIKPGPPLQQFHVALHIALSRRQGEENRLGGHVYSESGERRAERPLGLLHHMADTLEMPPNGKSDGRLNMISIVWLAASALSVLRRIDMVMLM